MKLLCCLLLLPLVSFAASKAPDEAYQDAVLKSFVMIPMLASTAIRPEVQLFLVLSVGCGLLLSLPVLNLPKTQD